MLGYQVGRFDSAVRVRVDLIAMMNVVNGHSWRTPLSAAMKPGLFEYLSPEYSMSTTAVRADSINAVRATSVFRWNAYRSRGYVTRHKANTANMIFDYEGNLCRR